MHGSGREILSNPIVREQYLGRNPSGQPKFEYVRTPLEESSGQKSSHAPSRCLTPGTLS